MSEPKEIKLVGCLPVIIGFAMLAATGCDYADVMIAKERATTTCTKESSIHSQEPGTHDR